MGQNSEISWTHHTSNLWWGCVEVSPLCDDCYAREWAKRYDRAKWGSDEPLLDGRTWDEFPQPSAATRPAGEVRQ